MNSTKTTYPSSMRASMCLNAMLKERRSEMDKESRKGFRERFATEFGCDPRTLTRYCNEGIRDVDTLVRLAEKLGISPWDMLTYEEGEDVPFLALQRQ